MLTILQCTRWSPTIRNEVAQNVNSAEVKKPGFRQWCLFLVLKWKENFSAYFFERQVLVFQSGL